MARLIDTTLRNQLSERDCLALEFLELLANDHHAIDDAVCRNLRQHFATAEIIELGNSCGAMIGTHRFMHTLNCDDGAPPIIRYDPRHVGVAGWQLEEKPSGAIADSE